MKGLVDAIGLSMVRNGWSRIHMAVVELDGSFAESFSFLLKTRPIYPCLLSFRDNMFRFDFRTAGCREPNLVLSRASGW